MRQDGIRRVDVTPGQEESLLRSSQDDQVVHAKRIESQHGAKTFPGPGLDTTKRESLPEIIIKGCPRCQGDLAKEDVSWGYGDYSCNACGRPYHVLHVHDTHLELAPVSRIATEEPKREGKRKERY